MKINYSFLCYVSFFMPCITSYGSRSSISYIIGSNRICSFSISYMSILEVISIYLSSFVVNLIALIVLFLFGYSIIVGRSSVCLSVLVRCCLPVLPSAIILFLSFVCDVCGGAGNDGHF